MLFNIAAVAAFLAGSAFAAPAAVNTTTDAALDFVVDAPLAVTLGAFMGLLETVSTVPDGVLLAGDDALYAWINPMGLSAVHALSGMATLQTRDVAAADAADAENTAATQEAVDGLIKDAECVAAVAAAIASDLLPAAKLLKVKSLIKVLGGIKKVAKLFLEFHKNRDQAIKEGGRTLLDLVEIVLGIDSIKKHCS